MDQLDRKILRVLRQNARCSLKELAESCGKPYNTVNDRLRKLEERGLIGKYTISISEKFVKFTFFCYLMVKLRTNDEEMEVRIRKFVAARKNIIFCDDIDGLFDYMMFVGCIGCVDKRFPMNL